MPASIRSQFQGTAARLSGLAGQRTVADPRGAGHGLHRSRRALRELHPSDHDSLHVALRRRGRLARADPVRHGFQCHRADRHHSADRHRQEERHHDDRFCLGGRAQGRQTPLEAIYQACLLRFRPIMMTTMAALLGGVPLALGTGIGRRAAAAARHHDRRRLDLQPVADALHDAGHLPGFRPTGERLRRKPRATARDRQLQLEAGQ